MLFCNKKFYNNFNINTNILSFMSLAHNITHNDRQ